MSIFTSKKDLKSADKIWSKKDKKIKVSPQMPFRVKEWTHFYIGAANYLEKTSSNSWNLATNKTQKNWVQDRSINAPKAMYKSILKMFKALNCLNSSNSLNLNCYNSYDSQTCLNLFRFNMIWIVTIHVILKHVWTCWNMSKHVQIQYIWIVMIHVILKHVWTCWNMTKIVQI